MGYSAPPFAVRLLFTGSMTDQPQETKEARLKRLRFRAWRRGFREIDLILGNFADRELSNLDAPGLDAFEGLLLFPNDQAVYAWIMEQEPPPADHDTPVLALIRAFALEMTPPPQ